MQAMSDLAGHRSNRLQAGSYIEGFGALLGTVMDATDRGAGKLRRFRLAMRGAWVLLGAPSWMNFRPTLSQALLLSGVPVAR